MIKLKRIIINELRLNIFYNSPRKSRRLQVSDTSNERLSIEREYIRMMISCYQFVHVVKNSK